MRDIDEQEIINSLKESYKGMPIIDLWGERRICDLHISLSFDNDFQGLYESVLESKLLGDEIKSRSKLEKTFLLENIGREIDCASLENNDEELYLLLDEHDYFGKEFLNESS